MKKVKYSIVALTSVFLLSACANDDDQADDSIDNTQEEITQEDEQENQEDEHMEDHDEEMGMDHMEHDRDGSPAPEGMVDAENPTYPVGSEAQVTENAHMDIMSGAIATISGAYDTTLYQVTFTPEGADEPEEDHQWVVQEEIESEHDSYEEGDTVILHADHMEGMDGQEATITGLEEGTAYMIDFEPTDGSEPFTNHKWVSEDELEPINN